MNISDPIGDMLARIKNGLNRGKAAISAPNSKLRQNVLAVLKDEGFIRGFSQKEIRKGISEIEIELKYHEGRPAIKEMKRVSKPGCRTYTNIEDLKPVFNGLGVAVLSTSQGVMSDKKARDLNVGGEVICTVF